MRRLHSPPPIELRPCPFFSPAFPNETPSSCCVLLLFFDQTNTSPCRLAVCFISPPLPSHRWFSLCIAFTTHWHILPSFSTVRRETDVPVGFWTDPHPLPPSPRRVITDSFFSPSFLAQLIFSPPPFLSLPIQNYSASTGGDKLNGSLVAGYLFPLSLSQQPAPLFLRNDGVFFFFRN